MLSQVCLSYNQLSLSLSRQERFLQGNESHGMLQSRKSTSRQNLAALSLLEDLCSKRTRARLQPRRGPLGLIPKLPMLLPHLQK
jgi:hypothetical protein